MDINTLKNLEKKYAQAIGNYLIERVKKDNYLLEKMESTDKTLKECLDYIKAEAKKQAEDGCAVLLDDEVYQMAVHFFLEDNIKVEKENVKVEKPTTKPVKEEKTKVIKKVEEKIKNQYNIFDFME